MRRLALVGLLASGVAHAQPQHMGPEALDSIDTSAPPRVTLLTFGPGELIFEKFGHSALCLLYPSDPEPICFNYGVTDFDAGSVLVWQFLRAKQRFWVEPEPYSSSVRFYRYEDRDIWEQELPLTSEQARDIEGRLRHDIQMTHRYYIYDHLFDNCTTRLRDLIDHATGGALRAGNDGPFPLTFRELGLRGLAGLPPLVGLTDFVLGRRLDDTPTVWQAMFYPAVLRDQVRVKLGAEPDVIYTRHGAPFPTSGSTFRLQLLALALVFALPLLVATWRRRFERVAVAWATVWLAGWGLVIWTLVILSAIPGVRWNEVALVLVPLDLALPFLAPARRRRYARVRVVGLLAVSALCALGLLHQPLWIPILSAIIPLATIAFGESLARDP